MTDTTINAATTFDFAAWEAGENQRRRRIAELRPANKAALFDVLNRADIDTVCVEFDGSGDSG